MVVEPVRSLLTRYNRVRRIKPPKNLGNRQLIRMLERRIGRDMVGPMLARKHNNYHQSDAKHFKFSPPEISGPILVHIYQYKLELVWQIYRTRGSTWCIIKLREWSVSTYDLWLMSVVVSTRKQWQKTLGIMFCWSSAGAGLHYYVSLDIWLHCLIPCDTIIQLQWIILTHYRSRSH